MYTEIEMRSLYHWFAGILEYPAGETLQAALEAQTLLKDADPVSAERLQDFYDYAASLTPGRLEEVYTGTFDLEAACHPYVGYHLFGETYKRSAFLVELKQRYNAEDFGFPATELPDHLAVILRFLATTRDTVQADEIARDALLPVLERMTGRAKSAGFDQDENADAPQAEQESEMRTQFHGVLEALRAVLQNQFQVLDVLETS
ncbi:MAG: nitrate reductase molybdenum cofactor assembly chaperone [Anaerolineales bacterium]|nr:nitrate reductase molybdenum cofactor assembly chaperone [Anaerolineales bacterium]MCZ2121459.1 nitrate reductase molybdenum cofactor assembly chaperone [Anaerolineales bacterium]